MNGQHSWFTLATHVVVTLSHVYCAHKHKHTHTNAHTHVLTRAHVLCTCTHSTEKLVPGEYSEPRQTWEQDLDAMVPPVLEDKKPCYIFFRLDERNAHQNYLWVFMSYTPDRAVVSTMHISYSTIKNKLLQ